MEYIRQEIMPGVMLGYLQTDKFKTSVLSLTMLTQLSRETASLNSLIPRVLMRGTVNYDSMDKITARMEELYGVALYPAVSLFGEIQGVGLKAVFPEESFLPAGADEFREVAGFLSGVLLSPATKGGLLQKQYVDSEKEKLIQQLESVKNDKRAYAHRRCVEEMCCYEDYSVGRFGSAENVEAVNYKKLTKQYHSLLQCSPVEIFYCGREDLKRVTSVLKDALSPMPRGELDYDIGTDLRINAVEDHPRFVREEMPLSQSRLEIGFRIGESIDDPDKTPISVFSALYGGSTNSRLFVNVREKKSLCYEAYSAADLRKGLLFAVSGIDAGNFEVTKNEMLSQLEQLKNGEFTDEELAAAKAVVIGDIRSEEDNPSALERHYVTKAIEGLEITPLEAAENAERVSREDILRVARGLDCDIIYFLTGSEEAAQEDADNE